MKVKHLKIDGFRGIHFDGPIDQGVIVLAGMNGTGKTTVIDAIYALLGRQSREIDQAFAQGVTGEQAEMSIEASITDLDKEYIAQCIRRSQGEMLATLDEVRALVEKIFPGDIFKRKLIITRPAFGWEQTANVREEIDDDPRKAGTADAALRHLVIRTDRLSGLGAGRILAVSSKSNLSDIAAAQVDNANRNHTTNFNMNALFTGRINEEIDRIAKEQGESLRQVVEEVAAYFNEVLSPFEIGVDAEIYESEGALELQLRDPFGNAYPVTHASSGQKQALALLCLSRSWARSPGKPILLMDEPDVGMHPDMISKVFNVISAELEGQAANCIITTHSSDLIKAHGQNVFRLERTNAEVELYKVENLEERIGILNDLGVGFDIGYLVRRIIFTEGENDSAMTLRDAEIYQILVDPLVEKVLFRSGPPNLGSKVETGNRAKVFNDVIGAIVGATEFRAQTLTDRDTAKTPSGEPNRTTPYRNVEYLLIADSKGLSEILRDEYGIDFAAADIAAFYTGEDSTYDTDILNVDAKVLWRKMRTNLVTKYKIDPSKIESLERSIIKRHAESGLKELEPQVVEFFESLKGGV